MTQEDWAVIEDVDEEVLDALPEATRRAILLLRAIREERGNG